MLQRLVVAWIVLLLTLPHVVHAQAKEGPSFDCKKANSTNEKIICSDAELSRKDVELAGIYRAAKSAAPNADEFKKAATAEWKLREQTCNDRACLIQWYEKRKLQLSAITNLSSAQVAPVAASSTTPVANTVKSTAPIAAASPVKSDPVKSSMEDETAIIARIKAKPTSREMVAHVRGAPIYNNVELHYTVDQFGEKPTCQFEIDGKMTDGRPIQARKFLFTVFFSGSGVLLSTGSVFGPPAPLRMFIDSGSSFVQLPHDSNDSVVLLADSNLVRVLGAAKSVKVLHGRGASGEEVAFVYDFSRIANIMRIGQALCGMKRL